MTDEASRPHDPNAPAVGAAPGPESRGAQGAPGVAAKGAEAQEWLVQLQHMIDRVAAEAAPIAMAVAAKAAELAAVAGEKAGPVAHRAADVTEEVGAQIARRSRKLADDLRHRGTEGRREPAETVTPIADEKPPVG